MRSLRILSSIVTVAVAFGASAAILCLVSPEPRETLWWFFVGPFSNVYFFGNMLASSVPLIFTGLAACVAFSAGAFNLGLEGQYYFGAIVGTIAALNFSNATVSRFVALVVSASAGALLSFVPALLKVKFSFNELIGTYMVGQIFVYVGDYLLNGPFRDPSAAFSATRYLNENVRLTRILPPSSLHVGYLIGIMLCFLFYFLYRYSTLGYEFRTVRGNPRFAKIHGINVDKILLIAMSLSGALAALGGMIDVLGVHGRAVKGFSHGSGFIGIAASLLASNDPSLIFLSALFLAYLDSGAEIASLMVQTPPEIARFVQGIVLCMVTAQFFLERRELDADSTA
ncbi:MAG: ABC transporter permease [Thermotoga caldifontis]|uniref:ABC transporter permease n=1 Tax=Thermotoga caldifontis TaxID=1508419 RepID=UPI003C7B760B